MYIQEHTHEQKRPAFNHLLQLSPLFEYLTLPSFAGMLLYILYKCNRQTDKIVAAVNSGPSWLMAVVGWRCWLLGLTSRRGNCWLNWVNCMDTLESSSCVSCFVMKSLLYDSSCLHYLFPLSRADASYTLRHQSTFALLITRTTRFSNSFISEFAICRRPSVCLSVCLSSVTFVRPTQAIEIFCNVSTPFGTLAIFDLSLKITKIVPGEPKRRENKIKEGCPIIAIFDLSNAISWKRCKIEGKLVLITNRKSYISFQLVPKSVTLKDLERRNGRYIALFYWVVQHISASARKKESSFFAISSADELLAIYGLMRNY